MCYTVEKLGLWRLMVRKILLMVLCLALTPLSALAAVSVRLDNGAALLTRDGAVLAPLGVYEDIVDLGGGLFAARPVGEKGYALMDDAGTLLTQAHYSDFRSQEGLLLANRDGFWGLLGRDGAELSRFEYTQIVPADGERFWVLRGDANDLESDELHILGADGSEVATGLYLRRMRPDAAEGLLAVLRPGSGLWGYCDAEGEMRIAARFSHAGSFINGRAVVVLEDGYGVIDTEGDLVVAPEYDHLEISPSGFILASKTLWGAWVFDLNGGQLARYEGEEISAALVGDGYCVADGERLRVYAADGSLLAEAGRDAAVSEGVNGQLILADGAWGEKCVRLSGTAGGEDQTWQHLYPLGTADGEGIYACMQANSARYINDLLGEIQISMDMESARFGVVDARGVERIPCQYDSIDWIADDRLLTRTGDYWQMLDLQGAVYWTHGVMQTEEPSS